MGGVVQAVGLSRGHQGARCHCGPAPPRPAHRSHTLATLTHLLFIVITWLSIEAALLKGSAET